MSELEKFLEERSKIPIPDGDVARVRLLAEELALGVHRNLWPSKLASHPYTTFRYRPDGEHKPSSSSYRINSNILGNYFAKRWENRKAVHLLSLLENHGYYLEDALTKEAFNLLEQTTPYSVFVSYKWTESSAFALLVVSRLNNVGHRAFCDFRLIPGDPYHPELKNQVKACEFLVLLLGPTTLNSSAIVNEVKWAISSDSTIIPVAHNGFDFRRKEWESGVPCDVLDKIDHNQRIEVDKESAAQYEAAIRTLLTNRFGVTP